MRRTLISETAARWRQATRNIQSAAQWREVAGVFEAMATADPSNRKAGYYALQARLRADALEEVCARRERSRVTKRISLGLTADFVEVMQDVGARLGGRSKDLPLRVFGEALLALEDAIEIGLLSRGPSAWQFRFAVERRCPRASDRERTAGVIDQLLRIAQQEADSMEPERLS